jgi:methylenetetrahydrofolate dehydrogenase (NADP+)/methenyltetrahydrofolate cyclohydrolase
MERSRMPVTFPTIGPWYSTEEAAEIMGRTPGHVSRLCKTGDLRSRKIGNSSYLLHEKDVKALPDNEFNPVDLANYFNQQLWHVVKRKRYGHTPRILGVLAAGDGDPASLAYAKTLQVACEVVGFDLTLVQSKPAYIESRIQRANDDPAIHGIFVFYPIFKDERDKTLKDLINPAKDIEGLSPYWADKLYANERFVDGNKRHKAILPCTSLGILKTLAYVDYLDERPGQTFVGRKIAIFNRSDVVGLPLAYMLKNDGATVYSFDINGGVVMRKGGKAQSITRERALRQSDVVITGVPTRAFEKIRGEEIGENVTCLNFSYVQNFEDSAKRKAGVYVPRVGPMTIAMCIRNAIRLYENNRATYERDGKLPTFTAKQYGQVVRLAP